MFERFTDQSRQVLVLAQDEARLLDHHFIGTEHILLGLLRARGSVAAQVLADLGVELTPVREQVAETVGPTGGPHTGSPPFTPRSKKVLELSLRELQQLGGDRIGTEHILLGLVREGEGVGVRVLTGQGVRLADVRQRIMQQLVNAQARSGPAADVAIRRRGGSGGSRTQAHIVTCSFCGLSPPESGQLISGEQAFICENCIRLWSRRLGTEVSPGAPSRVSVASSDVPNPGVDPEGADAARAEIRAAFSASRVPSEDGRSVPTVENGDDLGPTLELANEHHRGLVPDGSTVHLSTEEIRFVDTDHAAVWFSISIGDSRLLDRQRGEAVRVDGTWRMARSTFCQLMRMAGVACPPETP